MFHDLKENEQHYDRVLLSKNSLYYERFADDILESRPIVAGLLEKAFEGLFPEKVGSILDLGCGTAFYFPILSKHAQQVTGIDVCKPMLDQADKMIASRNLTNCKVLRSSAFEIPVEDHSIDVVHSWDFLHHVSDLNLVFQEIRRVLKPGGRFVAVEPNLLNPSIAWYHARRRSEWRLFTQNQFTIPQQLRSHFDSKIYFDNTIISFLNEKTYWIWKTVERFTSVWPFACLSFRYIIDSRLKK